MDLCLVPPSQTNLPSSNTRMMEVLWPSRPISIQPSLVQPAMLGYFSVKSSGATFRALTALLAVGGGALIRWRPRATACFAKSVVRHGWTGALGGQPL